ncbi:MAG: methylated-DNA--[protein]-cysteine S-methyltransferase [Proteobacteria bacterium]|nr:methylated-DNA--[protein]-cysteine S-methyltransferase [Pseudomonadota bacterium]
MEATISLITRARAYLDARRGERTTLEELGRAVGASPFHLQRSFKRVLGLSPRDYQQALRLEDTKRALAGGSRVTDAVFGAGYGSLSRFYEKAAAGLGMAARAYRAKGKGLAIAYTTFQSPLGCILLASTERGLCSVKLGDKPDALARMLAAEFSEAELRLDRTALKEAKERVLGFLSGDATLGRLPLDIRGTVFQQRVWSALRAIPRGETRTYKDIAAAIGAPKAVRAVGSACGANPVALVIPCHRALRTDGGLGGYAWGIGRKQKLLKIERKRPGQ